MKKILILLIALGAFAVSEAQTRIEARRTVLGAPRYAPVHRRTVVVVGPTRYRPAPRSSRYWRERRREEWRRQHYYHRRWH